MMQQAVCAKCGHRIAFLADTLQGSLSCPQCGEIIKDVKLGGRAQGSEPASPLMKRRDEPERKATSSPLPLPLEDPLRVLRRFWGWVLCLYPLIALAHSGAALYLLHRSANPDHEPAFKLLISYVAVYPALFAIWRILPGISVNAVYLRSFRHDAETLAVRQSLQTNLGPGFRLSGIRDPRRRWPKFLRYVVTSLFVFRYATPKFLSLEAGQDWKARLWRTLGNVRCAVIDVSDLTAYVVEEIRLCYRCIGLERILFIGNSQQSELAWRQIIGRALDQPGVAPEVRLVVWEKSEAGRPAFAEGVRQFANGLPPGVVGTNLEALPLTAGSSLLDGQPPGSSDGLGTELAVGMVLAFLIWGLLKVLLTGGALKALGHQQRSLVETVGLLPALALALCEGWHLFGYVREVGAHERVRTLTTFGFAICWAVLAGLLWPAVQQVAPTALRRADANNLKRLGLALLSYEHDKGHFPLADGHLPASRIPPVSWRVQILPYLSDPDASALFQAYRLDEPWDSRHNIQLVDRMPRAFAMPSKRRAAPPGHTFYCVLVSRWYTPAPHAAFTEGTKVSRRHFEDGLSNTILVVTAPLPVPWTKPDDLWYDPNGPLPSLGGHHRGGHNVLMADGFVRFLEDTFPEDSLRALITPNGREVNPD